MRVDEFSKYPYLYDGVAGSASEQMHAAEFTTEDGVFIVCQKDNEDVGIISGCPLSAMPEDAETLSSELLARNIQLSEVFYIGEVIVLPHLRSFGIGKELCAQIITLAAKKYNYILIATVIRAEDDPDRPEGYYYQGGLRDGNGFRPLQTVWRYEWPTKRKGETVMETHALSLWLKTLDSAK